VTWCHALEPLVDTDVELSAEMRCLVAALGRALAVDHCANAVSGQADLLPILVLEQLAFAFLWSGRVEDNLQIAIGALRFDGEVKAVASGANAGSELVSNHRRHARILQTHHELRLMTADTVQHASEACGILAALFPALLLGPNARLGLCLSHFFYVVKNLIQIVPESPNFFPFTFPLKKQNLRRDH